MGNRMKQRLERLAEENRKAYGGKKLDCCTINKNSVERKNSSIMKQGQ